MGRIILLVLIVATVVAVWYAFGPPARKGIDSPTERRSLGPDDDEEFLWQIEKERFKRRRAEQQELLDGKPDPQPKPKPQSNPEDAAGDGTDSDPGQEQQQ